MREVIHETTLFELTLDGGPGAQVALVLCDDLPAVVVLDCPDGVTTLTQREAGRLGAALLRAAQQARRGVAWT